MSVQSIYTVQSNQIVSSQSEEEWIDCVREDLYSGDNPHVYQQGATFGTRDAAEAFISDVCDLMHVGGDRAWFRIVKSAAS